MATTLIVVQDQRMLKLLMARDRYLNMDLLPLPLHSRKPGKLLEEQVRTLRRARRGVGSRL